MEVAKRSMGLDFDVVEYIKTIRASAPPYKCPVEKCDKSYKSAIGMQYHLLNFDHDTGTTIAPVVTPSRKKGRTRVPGTPQVPPTEVPKEAVTYNEALGVVQFEIDGRTMELSVEENLPLMDLEEYKRLYGTTVEPPPEPHIKLPEAAVKELKNYNICDAPPRPNAYIRFIEKSAEELDGEVEYDVDEEDTTWLGIINEKRSSQGLNPVSVDSLELLMDRLEKESYFQAAANGQSGSVVDDDAVCCICMDGECQNTNVILFCDMCNLAVHQDCYGVPYIPEGQWLCRRCLQSPSRPVDCVLCPNKGGAFKQTDRSQWAHVVCALWIPEVRFANTVFLEPIDSIETIPAARWRLSCYICKQKSVGACIQCHRTNCYAAFHVTCAQQAGLHMRMDTVRDSVTGNETQPIIVQKTAYCDAHTPAGSTEAPDEVSEKAREESRNKMKQARKLLAKKRTSVPVILIPTIPPERVQEIAQLVNIQKKSPFIQRLIAYWTLKRQYRNGVPLLRRLQSQGQSHSTFGTRSGIEGSPDTSELYQQLKYWQSLRQDLERARLLCELVRKREKLKVALIKVQEQTVMMQMNPVEAAMLKLLEGLEQKDNSEIFREPVDVNEVPDYTDIVKHPMDLSTMASKLKGGAYESLDDMEADFDLMIRNCLAYNNKDTIFYRAGARMRDQGGALFKAVRRDLEKEGLISVKKTDEIVGQEIDEEVKVLLQQPPAEKTVTKLQILLERAVARHGLTKTKRVRQLKLEIAKMKRAITKLDTERKVEAAKETRVSDGEIKREEQNAKTPPSSPVKATSSASPSGVNRRTAVLFTRKAQAALKKPDLPTKEDSSCDIPIADKFKTARKPGRKKSATRKSVDESSFERAKEKKVQGGKSTPTAGGSPKKSSPVKEPPFDNIPDSFRVYRTQPKRDVPDSDESDMSFTHSTCSSCSGFMDDGSGSDFGSSFDDSSYSDSDVHSSDNDEGKSQQDKNTSLDPLQLVWAKCTGYPWYPALIIDPQMPKGFVHNGVPLPVPPQDVLALRKNNTEPVFLVLFFDVKRTWQWLPANKLELLGLDKEVDQAKLMESRKPKERKAVKKAYQNALFYQSQVSELEAGQAKGRA